jgi:hypothetical protein
MPRTAARALASFAAALALAASAAAVTTTALQAQDPVSRDSVRADSTRMYTMRTRDGSLFVGQLIRATVDSVYFVSAGGPITVPRSRVVELREVGRGSMRQGVYWAPNPNDTRLFFAPTGRMLAKGEGYFSDTWVFLLLFAGGLTDRITLGAGFSVFPTDDFSQNVFYVTPKVGLIQSSNFNVAAGALIGVAGIADVDAGPGGIVYTVATAGSPDASVTFGGGFVFAGSDFVDEPVMMLGGERRVSRRVSLASENYLVPSAGAGLVSYGLRLFGERMSVDFAFANPFGADVEQRFPGWPYLAFAVKF